jgi:hypothetical protein
MTYVNGFIYGAGFTTAAILVVFLSQKLFSTGLCG